MDVMESGKPPLKDRGNMVTSMVSPKVTEGTNSSDGCTEEIANKTAELHNGGTQLGDTAGGVLGSKTKKDTNENAKKASKQGIEHATSTSEKWKLQFDLSDTASSSDSDGSEVEATDKIGEQHKEGPSSLKDDEMEDAMDFQGFDTDTTSQGCGMLLNKIIDLTESSLRFTRADLAEASTSYDDSRGMKESYYHSFISSIDENGMEDDDEKEDVTFALKIVSNPSSPLIKEEPMDQDSDFEDSFSGKGSNKSAYSSGSTPKSRTKASRLDSEDSTNSDVRKKKKKKLKEKKDEPSISEENYVTKSIEGRTDSDEMSLNDDRTKLAEMSPDADAMQVETSLDADKTQVKEMSVESESTKDGQTPAKVDSETSEKEKVTPTDRTKSGEASLDRTVNDITTPTKGSVSVTEEMSSELTSSTTSSPSLSSRGSLKLSAASGSSGGRYSRGVSPALSSSGGRGKKSTVDMSNPAFLKPFEFGWRRELVFRNTSDSAFKKMADIYYYTPAGKKVRSNREVSEYLDGVDLTMENFTFFKEAIGLNDPSKEIIRDAKKVVAKDPNSTPARKPLKPKLNTSLVSPASNSSPVTSNLATALTKGSPQPRTVPPKTFPKIKVSSVKLQRLPNTKLPPSKPKKPDSSEDGEMEIGMLPPMWSPGNSPYLKKTPGNSQSVTAVTWSTKGGSSGKKTVNEPCSIRCMGVMGLIPSLQCRLCLCLYHPECVGLGTITETIHSYVCKNCQHDVKDKPGVPVSGSKLVSVTNSKMVATTAAPPPLTPISALGVGNKSSPTDNTSGQSATPSSPPKLQRLPRLAETGKLITVPRFVKVPKSRESLLAPQQGNKGTGNKGTIVGSVTTWLPPSSTIQLSPSGGAKTSTPVTTSFSSSVSSTTTVSDSSATPSSTGVQAIARMGGKKYIVVPKHNVLSVSPAMAATATTPTSKSSVQVGDSSPLGDKAPVTLATSLVVSNTTGRTTTVLGGTQALVGQPQVLMAPTNGSSGDQTLSLVPTTTPLTNFVTPGGPILPTPSAYLVSTAAPGGLQNPPGVLLVPFVGSGSPFLPSSGTQDGGNKTSQQYLILNGPSGFPPGNFIIGNLQPPTVKAADAVPKPGESGDAPAEGTAREGEEVSNKAKRKLSTKEQDGPSAKRTKGSSTPTQESEKQHMQFFMMNICAGYSSLLHVFQYLKVQELLRAARVCRMWRDIASHASLWRTVRMKNSQVGDWEGLVKSLRRHETQHLDLRKMLVPSEDTNVMWDEFCRCIGKATSLHRLDLCRCPARVVEKVAESCPQLKVINALAIKCSYINLQAFANHKNLQELRLKSQSSSFHLTNTLSPLKQLSSLKHLSLTTFKELGKMEPSVLGSLKNLESLELGECCDFPEEFGPETLSRLKKLERLRLEKGQGKDCPTFSILEGIANLPKLTHLELVNFDVKPGFDKALAQCKNIRRLLIIPTYVTQSATTNHMVLNGVNHLSESLTHFVWGVTHELLRVTELFVDQCEGQKDSKTPTSKSGKKSWGSDSIPILKPIHQPSLSADEGESAKQNDGENCVDTNKNVADDSEEKDENEDAKASAAAPQVEILPLPKLQRLLTTSLPKTKVKILKIPFHATWRQTISESAP